MPPQRPGRRPAWRLALPLLLAAAGASAGPITVPDIVAELSASDYRGYVEDLVGFGTRWYATDGNAAATDYVRDTLVGFGLDTREHRFDYGGVTLANVEATLPGLVRPDDIFILGAHFDSIASRSPGKPSANDAPGADDNASGTAGMLEIASVLSRYRFEATIRFIGFNAEEQGMKGSEAYAEDAWSAGERILGMVNLDMIGRTDGTAAEDIEVIGDADLVALLVANITAFTSLPVSGHVETPLWSDHQWFAAGEYPGSESVMLIEDELWELWSTNLDYHKTSDTADKLDYGFALEVSRGAAAAMIDLAGLAGFAGVPVPVPAVWLLLLPGLLLMARDGRCRARRA
ncbi:M28 family metallopeptidase [Thiohalocapsa sp. ML1]|uniref:M28 family metallopeptidase n=1 Tax=Thiohalocapsa sp. ML1 TaxID=1431688 RepID=UPI00073200DD|nr:M20/M25/M40 family metallo-hydrolase [Thiohalocapsa sp. ML1]